MGRTYFISSDIHSFFDEWQKALKRKGFDVNNKDHVIVVVGDIFDRGKKPLEVYEFLRGLPKDRRILIRGNHEALLRDLVERRYAESHDVSNGTEDTLYYIAGLPGSKEHRTSFYRECSKLGAKYGSQLWEELRSKYERESRSVYHGKVLEILDWIYSDEWVNYWETPNHVFVHSWIPTIEHYRFDDFLMMYVKARKDECRDDWRNATQTEWEDAMWGCPWKKAKGKLNNTGKTIVCGHWHTSDFFNNLTKQRKSDFDCPIFKSKRYKLIGLDACTAGSGKVNCLVMKEEEL